MPDLSHLWQRFLLATALVFGLALGVGATVFGYSNTAPVRLGWSVFHVDGVPLWVVVLVPLGLILVAGTLFHWFNSLHHFSEHMRHRRRVHELEAEVTSLRKHLDELLQMPDHTTEATVTSAPAWPEAVASNGEDKVTAAEALEAKPIAVAANGAGEDAEDNHEAVEEEAPVVSPTAGS